MRRLAAILALAAMACSAPPISPDAGGDGLACDESPRSPFCTFLHGSECCDDVGFSPTCAAGEWVCDPCALGEEYCDDARTPAWMGDCRRYVRDFDRMGMTLEEYCGVEP